MTIDADRYYDAGPLVVRTEAVVDDGVVFRPVQAAGTSIDGADAVKAGRDEFRERFRRL